MKKVLALLTLLALGGIAGAQTIGPPASGGGGATLGANTFTDTQTITQGTATHSLLTSTGGSNTGSNAASAVDLAWTLNTTGSPDVMALRVTDTARGASTRLLNLYAGASGTTSVFSVDRGGSVLSAGSISVPAANGLFSTGTSGYLTIGVANGAGSPTGTINFNFGPTNYYTLATDGFYLSGNHTTSIGSSGHGFSAYYISPNGSTATGIWTAPSSGVMQSGNVDVASGAVAQTLQVQSNTGATTTGPDWTLIGSGGTTIGGNILFQTKATTTAATALSISPAGLVAFPLISTDATHTDASVCEDTTTHALYSGSGTLGICLGTSGRQFKTNFVPMKAGLTEISKINLWNYRYKDGFGDSGKRIQYGPTAQDVEKVLPDLVGRDDKGTPINYDSGALLLISLHAIQELKEKVDDLEHKLSVH